MKGYQEDLHNAKQGNERYSETSTLLNSSPNSEESRHVVVEEEVRPMLIEEEVLASEDEIIAPLPSLPSHRSIPSENALVVKAQLSFSDEESDGGGSLNDSDSDAGGGHRPRASSGYLAKVTSVNFSDEDSDGDSQLNDSTTGTSICLEEEVL